MTANQARPSCSPSSTRSPSGASAGDTQSIGAVDAAAPGSRPRPAPGSPGRPSAPPARRRPRGVPPPGRGRRPPPLVRVVHPPRLGSAPREHPHRSLRRRDRAARPDARRPAAREVDRRDVPRRREVLHRGPRHARLHRHLAGPPGLGPGLRDGPAVGWRSTSPSCSASTTCSRSIRVGSCGGLSERVAIRDVVIASGACTDSSMNHIRFEGLDYAPVADFGLLARGRGRRRGADRRSACTSA